MKLKIERYAKRAEVLLGIAPLALPLLLSLGLILGVVLPQGKLLLSLLEERSAAASRLERITAKATKLADLLSQQETLAADLTLVDAALPSSENVPQLMNQVQQIATESGVFLKGLNFGLGARGSTAAPAGVSKVFLQVEVWGPYSNLKAFLGSLEGASRLVIAENIKFDLVNTRETGETLKTVLTLASFYLEHQKDVALETPVTLDLSSPKLLRVLEELKELKVYRFRIEPLESGGRLNPFE